VAEVGCGPFRGACHGRGVAEVPPAHSGGMSRPRCGYECRGRGVATDARVRGGPRCKRGVRGMSWPRGVTRVSEVCRDRGVTRVSEVCVTEG